MSDEAKAQDFGEPWSPCGASEGKCKCLLIWSKRWDVAVAMANEAEHADREGGAGLRLEKCHEVNARIVACVNALSGIPDPEAFVKAVDELLYVLEIDGANGDMADELKALRAARGGRPIERCTCGCKLALKDCPECQVHAGAER